jgi:uncharacterized protein (DUF433 family)
MFGEYPGGMSMRVQDFLSCDPEVMSGAVVLKGSRVPVDTLFANISIEEFIENFPTIERSQAEAVLSLAVDELKKHFPNRRA